MPGYTDLFDESLKLRLRFRSYGPPELISSSTISEETLEEITARITNQSESEGFDRRQATPVIRTVSSGNIIRYTSLLPVLHPPDSLYVKFFLVLIPVSV